MSRWQFSILSVFAVMSAVANIVGFVTQVGIEIATGAWGGLCFFGLVGWLIAYVISDTRGRIGVSGPFGPPAERRASGCRRIVAALLDSAYFIIPHSPAVQRFRLLSSIFPTVCEHELLSLWESRALGPGEG